jgi:hypothetical protein
LEGIYKSFKVSKVYVKKEWPINLLKQSSGYTSSPYI